MFVIILIIAAKTIKIVNQSEVYIVERLGLTQNSNVMEIASNDGYLLQYFKKSITIYHLYYIL